MLSVVQISFRLQSLIQNLRRKVHLSTQLDIIGPIKWLIIIRRIIQVLIRLIWHLKHVTNPFVFIVRLMTDANENLNMAHLAYLTILKPPGTQSNVLVDHHHRDRKLENYDRRALSTPLAKWS